MIWILFIYFVVYILYTTFKNGEILYSLSHTAYVVQDKKWFCFTFWAVGLGVVYPLSLINVPLSILFTLGCFGVGLTPFYHSYGNITIFQFNSVGSEIIYILRT